MALNFSDFLCAPGAHIVIPLRACPTPPLLKRPFVGPQLLQALHVDSWNGIPAAIYTHAQGPKPESATKSAFGRLRSAKKHSESTLKGTFRLPLGTPGNAWRDREPRMENNEAPMKTRPGIQSHKLKLSKSLAATLFHTSDFIAILFTSSACVPIQGMQQVCLQLEASCLRVIFFAYTCVCTSKDCKRL